MLLIQMLLLMGLPPALVLGATSQAEAAGLEDTSCQDAFVFASPMELNFTHDGDVESVVVIAMATGGEDLEVELYVSDLGSQQSFHIYDPTHHCDVASGTDQGAIMCGFIVEPGEWPVIPIVYQPSASGADDVGWLMLSYTDSAGSVCESGQVMLDGYVE